MPQSVLLLTRLTGLAFVITGMMSAGMGVLPGELLVQLRRIRTVSLALIANFIVAPLLAWTLTLLIPMKPGHAAGLLLVGAAAGAPFLPKLAEIARGSAAFAISLMMLLIVGSVAFLPLALPLVLPGSDLPTWGIVRPLLLLIALPLCAGVVLRGRWPAVARRAEPLLQRTSDISLLSFVLLVVSTHLEDLWDAVGSGAILASILFTLLAGAAAYSMGGADPATRRVLALGTAQRNVAVALVVAESNFPRQPDIKVMVLVVTIVSLLMVIIPAMLFRRQDCAGPAPRDDRTAAASILAPPLRDQRRQELPHA